MPSSYENLVDTLLSGRKPLTMEEVLATLNSRELKKRTKGTKEETGDGLCVKGKSDHLVGNDEMAEVVMDSSRSYHITHKRNFMYDFNGFDGGLVQLGDNRTCVIKGAEKVKI
nr:zinc finger, CCHC-type [Tanacetum cinerariifolium]